MQFPCPLVPGDHHDLVGGPGDAQMATQIVGSLMALEAVDENEDIRIYINSPGDSEGHGRG